MFAGKRPNNLGINQGKLARCPETPNCVSSQSNNPKSRIEPLSYTLSPEQAITKLKEVIQSLPRTTIITEEGNYLYAEFKSKLMGYVDDVEFFLDPSENVIHVRSASRLGQSDLGVNRQRIETIRTQFSS